jgi:PAS domain S-box-containing protein
VTTPAPTQPLKVLLVEDNLADARLVRELLREAGAGMVLLTHAERLRQAVSLLRDGGFNAILLDLSLPDSDGLETFARARQEAPASAIVVLTGIHDEALALRAVREGAQDYLIKGQVDGQLLYHSLRYAVERGRVEEVLRRNEERYRLLFESNPQPMWVVDAASRAFLAVNDAAVRRYGYTRAEFLGRTAGDLAVPEIPSRRSADPAVVMARHRLKDGSVIDVEESRATIAFEDTPAVLVAIEDVTERLRAEQESRLLQSVTQAVAEAQDVEAALEEVLRLVCQAMGWPYGQAWLTPRGEADPLLLGPAWIAPTATLDVFRNGSETGRFPRGVGLPGRAWQSGGQVWVRDLSQETTWPRAAIAGRVGLRGGVASPIVAGEAVLAVLEFFMPGALEVDERQLRLVETVAVQVSAVIRRLRAEAELTETQARLQHLVSSSNTLLYAVAIEGERFKPLVMTDSVTRLFGYLPAETLTSTWWMDNVHPQDREPALQGLNRAFAEGSESQEYRFRHKDGSYRWVHEELAGILDSQGRPMEFVGVWVDITERKQLEAQFLQAQKMEAVGRLAGGVAHDFNNALTAILGYTDLLHDEVTQANQRDDLGEIRRAAQWAADLTRQLLAFSRQQVLEPRPLNLSDVVRRLEGMLRRVIGEDVTLSTVLSADLATVRADPAQIDQVIINLAVNARDAMPQGGRLTIETANQRLDAGWEWEGEPVTPGPYVMLAVSDSGSGMDDATRMRIFDPFFTTKEKGKGTGLGLATVYGVVKQSGGYLWVYSEVGHGTTFKVYLPQADTAGESPVAEDVPIEVPLGHETILVVEDDEAVRRVTQQMLARFGYTVLAVGGADPAVATCRERCADIALVISDVVMPDLSGPALVERLREVCPSFKVLYFSGYTGDAVSRHGLLQSGAFLQKPFTPAGLARKVREVLDQGT